MFIVRAYTTTRAFTANYAWFDIFKAFTLDTTRCLGQINEYHSVHLFLRLVCAANELRAPGYFVIVIVTPATIKKKKKGVQAKIFISKSQFS